MTYTSEQLLKHGDLILEWERSGRILKLEYYSRTMEEWRKCNDNPVFYSDIEYRKAPLYTNSLGEEFYEGDKVWYYHLSSDSVHSDLITSDCDVSDLDGSDGDTEICKTKSGALLLASKHYEK